MARKSFGNGCRRTNLEHRRVKTILCSGHPLRYPSPPHKNGHDPISRRLTREPGTDLILGDDDLWHIEADGHRPEISIREKHFAVSAQLV